MSKKDLRPSSPPSSGVIPRIIIHGGAGNITRTTLSRERYDQYQTSLRSILRSSAEHLSQPSATALDVATYAVTLFEDDPLYNAGKGAVFTRAGAIELESSVMVSNGYKKRGVGCMMLSHVKNPIKLARELLVRGEEVRGGGAQDHCQYAGKWLEELAREWGLEMCDPEYFWTRERWEEHKRGLQKGRGKVEEKKGDPDIEKLTKRYTPLGTVGAVVLDSFGNICVATSTGGLTNKVPGRIGDTPTIGAGFWAEEWFAEALPTRRHMEDQPSQRFLPLQRTSHRDVCNLVDDYVPSLSAPPMSSTSHISEGKYEKPYSTRHAVGMSGSGNGDTFIRMAASRTVAAKSRFTPTSLADAVTWLSGPGGELQKSAGDRWGHTHEGVGGIIAIELVGEKGTVICDYNCGGFFRAWTEEDGTERSLIFREDDYNSGPK
ncbi:L-asparaginase precursor [Westerdykella ornata]|uniref:L-asparaginase n=1 Tax=Westerdykella ornata TaxID=318751 RepID=A0A6A6J5Y4_WESOR|nr:L-asparaginase precursor [Westerdykella ornata]KAF2271543.1 L-asparaginase precursor [Westerdykella ornata]